MASFSKLNLSEKLIRKQTTKRTHTVVKMNDVRNEIIDLMFLRNRETKIKERMYFVVDYTLEWNKMNLCPCGKA